MTRVITSDLRIPLLHIFCALLTACLLAAFAQPARPANIIQEDRPMADGKTPVTGDAQERVVVVPEAPHWSGWGDWWPGFHRSAPRIRLWVDRGEWSTYRPGDRLWVYFRVDRPCYVTILDYAPDGRVDTIYPSRWSGSSFVSPGITYRIPESRRYSLRIAGSGGIETLVACAHESPWPSGPGGVWIPRHRPDRGRVVVGRPGGSPPPGWRGRVRVHPDRWPVCPTPGGWPVPPAWRDRPELWSCDSVSFYVDAGGSWRGAPRDGGHWYDHRDGYRAPDGYRDGCPYGDAGWGDDAGWRDDGRWGDGRSGSRVFYEQFRMESCRDVFYREVRLAGEEATIRIECVESSGGKPTEIVGRLIAEDGRDDLVFRVDLEGKHGERPYQGQMFYSELGRLAVEVRVTELDLKETKPRQEPRLESIEFTVRAHAR